LDLTDVDDSGYNRISKNRARVEPDFKKSRESLFVARTRKFQKVLLVHLEVQKGSAVKKHADLDDGLVGV
jgi:hypothetical protein